MKVLVVAHGHPHAGIGGGELAARNLFLALKDHPKVSAACFLARTGGEGVPPGAIDLLSNGEYLWRRRIVDWFELRAGDEPPLSATFRDFLLDRSPDVVFVHHYVHLGLEFLGEIRRTLPAARLVLTLHDFAAICHNGGLMTKTGFGRLPCGRAEPEACHACFPERTPQDFANRRAGILDRLAAVDRFVAPSRFLAERYVEWGVPASRLSIVENGLEPMEPLPPVPSPDGRVRLGFFGQVREAKGLDILLGALHLLAPQTRARFVLDVNGSRLEAQAPWYRTLIERLREPLMAKGTVRWPGAYVREELPERMRRLDWVVVPSAWWENSPLVVQEAFAFRLPVIGAAHGGIAEKVRDGVDGLLFPPRDAHALADLLCRIVADPSRREALADAVRPPLPMAAMGAAYLDLAFGAA